MSILSPIGIASFLLVSSAFAAVPSPAAEPVLQHYTTLVDVFAVHAQHNDLCANGHSWLGIKVWAVDIDEAAHMTELFSHRFRLKIHGKVLVYKTEPAEPSNGKPRGYGITCLPYKYPS